MSYETIETAGLIAGAVLAIVYAVSQVYNGMRKQRDDAETKKDSSSKDLIDILSLEVDALKRKQIAQEDEIGLLRAEVKKLSTVNIELKAVLCDKDTATVEYRNIMLRTATVATEVHEIAKQSNALLTEMCKNWSKMIEVVTNIEGKFETMGMIRKTETVTTSKVS
jgi:predicted  nucleic acid-binding Zn-ribbon protein